MLTANILKQDLGYISEFSFSVSIFVFHFLWITIYVENYLMGEQFF